MESGVGSGAHPLLAAGSLGLAGQAQLLTDQGQLVLHAGAHQRHAAFIQAGLGQQGALAEQVPSHTLIGHFPEHRGGHVGTVDAAVARRVHHHDAAVLGLVGREIPAETGGIRFGILPVFKFPSRARLAGNGVVLGLDAAGRALQHHSFHHGFDLGQRGIRTNLGVQHHGFVALQHLVGLLDFFYDERLHFHAAVGNGIVEGQGLQRGQLQLVANAHRRERGTAPAAVRGVLHVGAGFAGHLKAQGLVQTELLELVGVFGRVGGEIFIHELGHANVARLLEHLLHRDAAVAVRVRFHGAAHVHPAVAGIHHVIQREFGPRFKQGHHRRQLKGRAGFGPPLVGKGVVVILFVRVVGGFPQVGHGFNFAGRHFHQNHAAVLGIIIHQRLI